LIPWPGGGLAQRRAGGVPWFGSAQTLGGTRYKSECFDSLGRGSDHPMDIVRDDRTGLSSITGIRPIGSGEDKFYQEWFPSYFYSFAQSHLPTSIAPIAEVATSVLARSNPSRAEVQTLNFIYELKDLPMMVKEIGDFKLKRYLDRPPEHLANFYLSHQMGWKPLFRDIKKMLMFQDAVDKRVRELERLQSKGGFTRRIRSDSWKQTVASDATIVTIESNLGDFIDARKTSVTSIERWGSTRWAPSNLALHGMDAKEIRRFARDLVFGLNASPKYVWDAFPWTWMIDWFTNTGDFMAANANRVPANASVPCVMTKTRTVTSFTRVDNFKEVYRGGDGSAVLEWLSRTLHPGFLTATAPFIGSRHLSILSSLAVQRAR